MITPAEHLDRLLADTHALAPERVPLADALGSVLAEGVDARLDLPAFDNSAMDGYAVRAADVASGLPVRLPVAGDIAAGDGASYRVEPGSSFRIMTGAPMPEGADTVVPVEQTDGGEHEVRIDQGCPAGRHVRRRGEDMRCGQRVLEPGVRLGARQIALLAASGHGDALVIPPPLVAVLSTGDELAPAGTTPAAGQIVDSNGPMLVAALREAGMRARLVAHVDDTDGAVAAALAQQARDVDAIVTTGGVSMGAYDAVKAVLRRTGTVRFDRVAMQPGKPQGYGRIGERGVPVFTLPGNPVSAFVSFTVFVAPALRVMAGRAPHEEHLVRATASQAWGSPEGKVQFARGVLTRHRGHHSVRPCGGQGSHVMGGLAAANALVVVPADVTRVEPGQALSCLPVGPLEYADERAADDRPRHD